MDMHPAIESSDDLLFAFSNADQTDDNATLPIELTNTTGMYLDDLNEECLLQIFSSDSLTPMDLCALAETCVRFKQITQRVLLKELRVECYGRGYHRGYYVKSINNGVRYKDLQNVERILRNFGPHLTTLILSQLDQDFLNLVAQYCNSTTVKYLQLDKTGYIEDIIVKLKPIFHQRLTLSISNCYLVREVTILEIDCNSLIALKILRAIGCRAILTNTFPNLELFFYRDFLIPNSHHYNDILHVFVSRHKRLKTLKISSGYCTSDLLHTIVMSCKELESLTLKIAKYPETSVDFSKLVKLKTLSGKFPLLENSGLNIGCFQAINSLTTVKLYSECIPVRLFNVLSKMENLRELHFNYCRFPSVNMPWAMLIQLKKLYFLEVHNFYQTDFLKVIRKMPNLEEITCPFSLDQEYFDEIVKIVKERTNVLTLHSTFNFDCLKHCGKYQKLKISSIRKKPF